MTIIHNDLYGRYILNDNYIQGLINLVDTGRDNIVLTYDKLDTIYKYLNTYGVWYGGDTNINGTVTYFNTISILNFRADLINLTKTIGTARARLAGGGIGSVGVYYGGNDTNTITKLNAYGYIYGSETNAGLLLSTVLSSAVINNIMLVFGGVNTTNNVYYDNLQFFNSEGTLLNNIQPAGVSARTNAAGVGFVNDNIAMYYGGSTSTTNYINNCIRFDQNGNNVGVETNIGTTAYNKAGCLLEDIAVYFGGSYLDGSNNSVYINELVRIDVNQNQVGSTINIGTPRDSAAAASFGDVGVYYSGNTNIPIGSANSPIVIRLRSDGSVIGQEFSLPPGRGNTGVAAINL